MTVEQLMIELWKCPSDTEVVIEVFEDSLTEKSCIHDFDVIRVKNEVHLIEKSN